MNPVKVKDREDALALKREEQRLQEMDDELHDRSMKDMFYNKLGDQWKLPEALGECAERSECEGVIPARERLKQYKTRHIRRNIPNFAQKS